MSKNESNVTAFDEAVGLMRQFFLSQGFVELHPQSRLSVLAACEVPQTIGTFDYDGENWPLPQTGQIWLEYELLNNPEFPGFFCVTTPYRQEPDSIPERHEAIFPMVEFETHGGIEELLELEGRLLAFLGFGPMKDYTYIDYADAADRLATNELTPDDEEKIQSEFGHVCFLKNFPAHTSPFWNMKYENGTANKVDLILYGMETISSAERSCDRAAMREKFITIDDGKYAQALYDRFGKERVDKEMDEFLSYEFFPRSGGGIDITRMMQAMQKADILSKQHAVGGFRLEEVKSREKFA